VNSSQNVTTLNVEAAKAALVEYETAIKAVDIPNPTLSEIEGDLGAIKAQLNKPTPSTTILSAAGRSLKSITEGVIAGILTPQAMAGAAAFTVTGY
jgi:hypothetical protein